MKTADVIIIGGGMAGLCAAVEAAENGLQVSILEKEDSIGGSSLLSGCFMAFAETELQKQLGIVDSIDSLVEDLLVVGQFQNDEKLVQSYGKHQLETYNWLVEHGVVFKDCQAASGHSNPRGHTIVPQQAIEKLKNCAMSHQTELLLNSPVKRLLIEDEKVIGVVYEEYGIEKEFFATKAVIICAGGFSQSKTLLHAFAPQLDGILCLGGKGNMGDGIKLAAQSGAWLTDFPYLKGTYGFHPSSTNDRKRQAHTFYKGGIIVNQEGQRFINESLSYKLIGDAALQQKQKTFQIFDEAIMSQSVIGDALYDFKLLLKEGLIKSSDTIRSLAVLMNINEEQLLTTIENYNINIDSNTDEFNRGTLTHTFGKPIKLSHGPYYAMETVTAMLATYAGIKVNEFSQVINSFGEPIDQLYAAGEVVGGFHGAGYMTGSSLGKAAIFGRVAAKNILNSNKKEVNL